jgi:segregation and condensation protein B
VSTNEANLEITEVKATLEALLFASDKPLGLSQVAKIVDGAERKVLHQCLDELRAEYEEAGRGFKLAEVAEGWQMVTRPQHAAAIRKLARAKSANRLSRPSLETLAIIAYRQPLTKAEVEAIRGVNADGVLSSLLEKKLARTVGRKDVPGRPLLYGTTREFLHMFGLKDLNELPRLAELKDLLKQDSAGEMWELDEKGVLVEKKAEDFLKDPEAGSRGQEAEEETKPEVEAKPEAQEEDVEEIEEDDEDEDEEDDEDDDDDEDEEEGD